MAGECSCPGREAPGGAAETEVVGLEEAADVDHVHHGYIDGATIAEGHGVDEAASRERVQIHCGALAPDYAGAFSASMTAVSFKRPTGWTRPFLTERARALPATTRTTSRWSRPGAAARHDDNRS